MKLELVAEPIVTHHSARCNSQDFDYTATISEVAFLDSEGVVCATFCSYAYVRDSEGAVKRPVIFAFNGGPGASSLYTHMNGFGPICTDIPDVADARRGGPRTVANEHSLLDAADLVFIDPPGTGFARVAAQGRSTEFYGLLPDARAFAGFIRDWLSRNGRWSSPKYVMGESYGTLRAALLSRELMGSYGTGMLHGAGLDGVIVLGQGMNIADTAPGNPDTPYILMLPTYAALAWHYRKGGGDIDNLEDVLEQARKFAAEEYSVALHLGTRLSDSQARRIVGRLAELTGINESTWRNSKLRVGPSLFAATLLAADGKQLGLYDGRYSLPLPGYVQDPVADDPMLTDSAENAMAALQAQLHGPLNGTPTGDYKIINFEVNSAWDFSLPENGPPVYLDVSGIMAASMNRSKRLRLFVGSGAYDLVTPWGAAEHMLTRGNFPVERTIHRVYASGHSIFICSKARGKLAADLRNFVCHGDE
ncbi:S10 family serine carboxypeptidase-like protein [Burkholderia pyrrocinia]|uniref:S10 family peptidase n=1 Tax=Burkholderia pyrrocinia TaxID=60550 RepID=UPI002AB0A6BF|nr:hypothetical protein [Burkholderia pyrrocinia]